MAFIKPEFEVRYGLVDLHGLLISAPVEVMCWDIRAPKTIIKLALPPPTLMPFSWPGKFSCIMFYGLLLTKLSIKRFCRVSLGAESGFTNTSGGKYHTLCFPVVVSTTLNKTLCCLGQMHQQMTCGIGMLLILVSTFYLYVGVHSLTLHWLSFDFQSAMLKSLLQKRSTHQVRKAYLIT